jgi:hypothetical protein
MPVRWTGTWVDATLRTMRVIIGVVAVVALVACGGDGGGERGSERDGEPAREVEAPATAEFLAGAVEQSLAEPRRLELAMAVGDGEPVTVLEGVTDGERTATTVDAEALAEAGVPDADGAATLEVVIDGSAQYVRSSAFADVLEDPSAGSGDEPMDWNHRALRPLVDLGDGWGRVDVDRFADADPASLPAGQPIADPNAMLRAVALSERVRELGQDEVGGEPVAGLVAEVPYAAMGPAADQVLGGQVNQGLGDAPDLVVPVEVYVDDRGRIRRLHVEPDAAELAERAGVDWSGSGDTEPVTAAYTLELGDYGADDLEVEVPADASDVTEAYGDAVGANALPAGPPADGTDIAACADGSCDVEVTLPVTIPLDGTLGLPELRLQAGAPLEPGGPPTLEAIATPGGAFMSTSLRPGGQSVLNSVSFELASIEGSVARVVLMPCPNSSCLPPSWGN